MNKFFEYTVMVVSLSLFALMLDMSFLGITPSELYQDILCQLP